MGQSALKALAEDLRGGLNSTSYADQKSQELVDLVWAQEEKAERKIRVSKHESTSF